MPTKAEDKRSRFIVKANQLGYRVTRTRPMFTNKAGVTIPAQTATYNVIDDVERPIKDREMKQVGTDNQSTDGFKAILFPWNADVKEGDELALANIAFTYHVTKADNPLQIGSQVVYWQVEAIRKTKF